LTVRILGELSGACDAYVDMCSRRRRHS
jgi:hypothetical protein